MISLRFGASSSRGASHGIYFELRLAQAMAAGGCSGVWREAEAVEDGAKRQKRHEEDSEMKVAQLGHGGRVTVRVGDEALNIAKYYKRTRGRIDTPEVPADLAAAPVSTTGSSSTPLWLSQVQESGPEWP